MYYNFSNSGRTARRRNDRSPISKQTAPSFARFNGRFACGAACLPQAGASAETQSSLFLFKKITPPSHITLPIIKVGYWDPL
jgi:hypothetical protein